MLRGDEQTRDWLADAIRGAVDDVVIKHAARLAQEPQVSAKIADRLEQRLDGMTINGYHVSVVASDMPDRGRGSLEKPSGVDLYIAVRVRRRDIPLEIAKGVLVQGKFDTPFGAGEQRRLIDQCGKMCRRSRKGSFVWLYGSDGAIVVPATDVLAAPKIPAQLRTGRNIARHFRDVLDCVAGDEELVKGDVFGSVAALNAMMRELAAREAVAIDVSPG